MHKTTIEKVLNALSEVEEDWGGEDHGALSCLRSKLEALQTQYEERVDAYQGPTGGPGDPYWETSPRMTEKEKRDFIKSINGEE